MRIDEFKFETVVSAERGYYLKYKNAELQPEKVGKPIRMIFSKTGIIPDLEEVSILGDVSQDNKPEDEVKEVKSVEKKATTKKTTRKATSK